MELEADEFAVVLMRRSGLAAGSAVAFLERLGRWGSDSHMPLSQIRPPLQTRLARLRELTGN
jgi:predicted Zn-dependent protease